MTEVLVTGKRGFVGSNLPWGGPPSSAYDLRSFDDCLTMLTTKRPEKICHCASVVGGLGAHINSAEKHLVDNTLININLLDAAKRVDVRRILSFGSSCMYPSELPTDVGGCAYDDSFFESDVHCGEPSTFHTGYAYSKRTLDIYSRMCYDQGFLYNMVIPTNIYGPGEHTDDNGHVVGVLIRKCVEAKKNNTDFVVWGNGSQERQFLFIKDVVDLTKWAMDNYLEKEPLNFSNNTVVTIKELALLIAQKVGFTGRIVFDDSKPTGQKSRLLSGNKLKSLLPTYQFTSLEVGIEQTVDWYVFSILTSNK